MARAAPSTGSGAGAQLVEQHQGIPVRPLQDAHGVGHVRGEGGQVLLDALLIADVREDLAEDAEFRADPRRNVQAGLPHEGEEADGL